MTETELNVIAALAIIGLSRTSERDHARCGAEPVWNRDPRPTPNMSAPTPDVNSASFRRFTRHLKTLQE
jgi:hypothetical protein